MRVLLMPASYPPVLGGVQTVAHNLAMGLVARGETVRVVTNRYPRSLPAREVIDGVNVERLHFLTPALDQPRHGRLDLLAGSFWYAPVTYVRLDRLMSEFKPDVVNVHFPDGQVPFVRALRRRHRFRLVVSLHGHEVLRWTEAGASPKDAAARATSLRWILREADAVTVCSAYLLGEAVKLEPSIVAKATVIHNGVDLDRFADKTPYPHPRAYVLAYGRLTEKKGFDLLIAAFAAVADEHPDVDLLIAGDGEERDALLAQAARLGLADRVRLLGRASPVEIVRLLNGCLFLAVPSRVEPFGIVAIEGLAAGKPVLATRVGGLPEVVGEDAGLLVEPSVEGLTGGLAECLVCLARDGLGQRVHAIAPASRWLDVVDRYSASLQAGVIEDD